MSIRFEKLCNKHQTEVMKIFNYHIANGTSAFPQTEIPEEFYKKVICVSETYPGYAIIETEESRVVGFCMIKSYHPLSTFSQTMDFTIFLDPKYTGKGIGKRSLELLEQDAKEIGVKHLVSLISSENEGSCRFHKKNGFYYCGELKNIGHKHGRDFGIIMMEKDLGC